MSISPALNPARLAAQALVQESAAAQDIALRFADLHIADASLNIADASTVGPQVPQPANPLSSVMHLH